MSVTWTARTVGEALTEAAGRLAAAGVPEARRDARLLLCCALGVGPEAVLGHPERPIDPAAAERLRELTARRAAREPVARILGEREFWSLPLRVTPATLDPRPDSETLVEAVLAEIADRAAPRTILDLGTGTGCLLLALLSELPGATGIGVDISLEACMVAAGNAERLGLQDRARFLVGDWGRGLDGRFGVIVCNPPYIADTDIDGLEPEVSRFDPRSALSGGPDGLACYRAVMPDIARLLAADGVVALEIGATQAASVASILAFHHLKLSRVMEDLSRNQRCVIARRGIEFPNV